MQVAQQWSHLGGGEIVNARFPDALGRVYEAVAASACVGSANPKALDSALRDRLAACSAEHGSPSQGAVHVATSDLRTPVRDQIIEQQRDFVPVAVNLKMTGFGFGDAADLESLYRANEADAGVLIVPSPNLAQRLYPGSPEAVSLLGDQSAFAKQLPIVPLLVLALDA